MKAQRSAAQCSAAQNSGAERSGAERSRKDAHLPAASWLSRWTCRWVAHHSPRAQGSGESQPIPTNEGNIHTNKTTYGTNKNSKQKSKANIFKLVWLRIKKQQKQMGEKQKHIKQTNIFKLVWPWAPWARVVWKSLFFYFIVFYHVFLFFLLFLMFGYEPE